MVRQRICHIVLATLLGFVAGCGPTVSVWTEPAERAWAAGDASAAIALYEEALIEFPGNPEVETRLGLMLIAEGDRLAAAEEYALADDRYNRGQAIAGAVVRSPELLVRHADVRANAGADWPAVAELLEGAFVPEAPDMALAERLALGWSHANDSAKALQWFLVQLSGDPTNVGVQTQVAQLHEDLGDTAAAIAVWTQILTNDADSRVARASLADLYEAAGQKADAEALLIELAQANPKHPGGWRQLLKFYRRHGDQAGQQRVQATLDTLIPADDRKMRPLR